jgi:DNA-binding MarR family transcriptional regulator
MFREDLSRNFGFLLNDVARLLRTVYDRRIRNLGLTRAQWWVLTHLFRGDGVNQSELAETLEIEKPTLGRLLDRLEAKGWVRREHDARDRRVWRVHLTREVEPALRTMRTLAAELRRDALAGIRAAERERFVDTLLAIKANLLRIPADTQAETQTRAAVRRRAR